jgi:hypothetical protein
VIGIPHDTSHDDRVITTPYEALAFLILTAVLISLLHASLFLRMGVIVGLGNGVVPSPTDDLDIRYPIWSHTWERLPREVKGERKGQEAACFRVK